MAHYRALGNLTGNNSYPFSHDFAIWAGLGGDGLSLLHMGWSDSVGPGRSTSFIYMSGASPGVAGSTRG